MAALDVDVGVQMPVSALLLLATLLLSIHLLYRAIVTLYFHPLSAYPGPRLWALSSLPYVLSTIRGNVMQERLAQHKKYGPVVRVAPNELSYSTAVVWRDVYAYRKGHEEFSKGPLQLIKPPNGVFGILGANRFDHRRYRRLLSGSFSERSMREQQPTIMKHVDMLVDRLRSAATDPEPQSQNLVEWFNWTTFDVIGELAFGESFGCLEHVRMHPWIDAVFGNLRAGIKLAAIRRLGLDWILPHLLPKKVIEQRLRNQAFASDRIEKRVALGPNRGDFWDAVLAKEGEEGGMTLKEMESNASNLVLGGSETTATLLSGCFYLLLRHPHAMHNVVQEIRSAFSSADQIDLFTVNKLPYTLAVLDETMRIYPPVPSQAGRLVPAGGDTVDGKYLPEGVFIHLPQFPAYHLESNFTRPDEFIPERFLGAEEFKHDQFDVLQPFSVGPRNCIGKSLAYAEMRLILAKLLWNFDFELDERTGDWLDQRTFVLWEKKPLLAKIKERTN